MFFKNRIGLGTSGWAFTPEAAERQKGLMGKVIDLGYRMFDTAEQYSDGRVETLLGGAISSSKIPRSEFEIVSKVLPINAMNRDSFRDSLKKSLDRLQTDYVDSYLLHFYMDGVSIEQCAEWMAECQSEGTIRSVGCSNLKGRAIHEWQSFEESENYPKEQRLQVVQFRYGPKHRYPDQFYTEKGQNGYERVVTWNTRFDAEMTGMPHSVFGGGRASGYQRHQQNPPDSYKGDFWDMPELKQLAPIAESIGATVPQFLIAFFNLRFPWAVSIPRSKKIPHLKDNLEAGQFVPKITNSIREQVDEIFPVPKTAQPGSYENRK